MIHTLLIGTHNEGKTREIQTLLKALPIEIKTLKDFPKIEIPEETGQTLEANAQLKAKSYAQSTGLLTLADDTGLEVEALNGAPGVYSARYAGENCSYEDNNRKLIAALSPLKFSQRRAIFRTVIALYDPRTHDSKIVSGELHGLISDAPKGLNGFGYDPVFFIPTLGKTLAELTLEEKNKVSHRAQALLKVREILKDVIELV